MYQLSYELEKSDQSTQSNEIRFRAQKYTFSLNFLLPFMQSLRESLKFCFRRRFGNVKSGVFLVNLEQGNALLISILSITL